MRKMFVACGGLSAVVHFLDGDYEHTKELMAIGLECIYLIFDAQVKKKHA